MNKVQLHELILDYLDGKLDPSFINILTKELEGMGYNLENLEELRSLVNTMDEVEIPEPGPQLSDRFYEMLDQEIQKSDEKTFYNQIMERFNNFMLQPYKLKLSYGLIMLLIGWFLGFWVTPNTKVSNQISEMNEELQQMKEMVMVNMLDQPMVSDRLLAMNMISSLSKTDDEIVESLLNALNNDSDVNVRMAAVEALLAFANQEKVREGLKHSFNQQNSPLVQLTLLDGFIATGDKSAIPIFESLMNNNEVNQVVRDRSREGITKLI